MITDDSKAVGKTRHAIDHALHLANQTLKVTPSAIRVSLIRSLVLFFVALISLWSSVYFYCFRYGIQPPFEGVPFLSFQHLLTIGVGSALTIAVFFALPRAIALTHEQFTDTTPTSRITRLIIGVITVLFMLGIFWVLRATSKWTYMDSIPRPLEIGMLIYFSVTGLIFNVVGKQITEHILSALFWILVAFLLMLSVSKLYAEFLAYLRIGGGIETNVVFSDGDHVNSLAMMLRTNTEVIFWDPSTDRFIYVPQENIRALEMSRVPYRNLPKPVREF